MAEKVLRTKIALLYKTYAEWDAIKDSYIPLKGEVCICDVPVSTGAVKREPAILIKVGDGVKSFEGLPWLSALSADVYDWAKKENLEFSDLSTAFIEALDLHISGKVQDTNTKYQFRKIEGTANYQLQSKELNGEWIDVEGQVIEIPQFDPAALIARIAAVESAVAKKPNIIEEGTNGTARLFNEKDGGGAKFEHVDGSESFVGVNDGGKDGMMAQIYADIKEDGAWVGSRINIYHNGIYYVSKAAQLAGSAKNNPDREIATIGDIKALGKPLNFRGVFNSLDEVTDPKNGDVAIVGEKEYIYAVNGGIGAWKEFGDVSMYATKAELEAEIARATAAEEALYEYVDDSINDTMNFIIQERDAEKAAREAGDNLLQGKIDAEEARAKAEEAKKVNKVVVGTKGTAEIFNESDGGGAKFTGTETAFVGVHDSIGGEIGVQAYVDNAAGDESTIIDITQNGAYYTKGELKPGAQRDVEANEIAVKGDITALEDSLAAIAKTGNVNDLIQTEGDILVLNCNL